MGRLMMAFIPGYTLEKNEISRQCTNTETVGTKSSILLGQKPQFVYFFKTKMIPRRWCCLHNFAQNRDSAAAAERVWSHSVKNCSAFSRS